MKKEQLLATGKPGARGSSGFCLGLEVLSLRPSLVARWREIEVARGRERNHGWPPGSRWKRPLPAEKVRATFPR